MLHFFLLIPVSIFFLSHFIRAIRKWNKSCEILTSIHRGEFSEYKNLKIRSDSKRSWKTIWTLAIDGIMLISEKRILILPKRLSFSLSFTQLPVSILRDSKTDIYELKYYGVNDIRINHETHTRELGKCTIEYAISSDDAILNEVYDKVKNKR